MCLCVWCVSVCVCERTAKKDGWSLRFRVWRINISQNGKQVTHCFLTESDVPSYRSVLLQSWWSSALWGGKEAAKHKAVSGGPTTLGSLHGLLRTSPASLHPLPHRWFLFSSITKHSSSSFHPGGGVCHSSSPSPLGFPRTCFSPNAQSSLLALHRSLGFIYLSGACDFFLSHPQTPAAWADLPVSLGLVLSQGLSVPRVSTW